MVHRLRALLKRSTAPGAATSSPAFVPCPGALLTGYTPAQLEQVQELYRLARAQAEATVATDYWPHFSAN